MEDIKVTIKKEILNYLNVLDFEAQANRMLVAYMLNNNMDTDTDAFKKYDNDYKENVLKMLELEKEMIAFYIPEDIRQQKACAPEKCGIKCLDRETGVITI